MILTGQCDKCNGVIEFEDSLHKTSGTCPLCQEPTIFVSEEESKYEAKAKEAALQALLEDGQRRRFNEARRTKLEEARNAEMSNRNSIKRPSEFQAWGIGSLLLVISSIAFLFFLFSPTTVGSTVNLDLLHNRETGLMMSCSGGIVGTLCLILATLSACSHNQRAIYHRQETEATRNLTS